MDFDWMAIACRVMGSERTIAARIRRDTADRMAKSLGVWQREPIDPEAIKRIALALIERTMDDVAGLIGWSEDSGMLARDNRQALRYEALDWIERDDPKAVFLFTELAEFCNLPVDRLRAEARRRYALPIDWTSPTQTYEKSVSISPEGSERNAALLVTSVAIPTAYYLAK